MKGYFSGGIHPADRKELTSGKDVTAVIRPSQVIIPLRQHIGAPCEPLVKVGDQVKLGQKIGDGQGMAVPVHASVSGRVVNIEERSHPGGGQVLSVVIENDGWDTPISMEDIKPWKEQSNKELIRRIREGGVVGMGGAAFPTEIKLDVGEGEIHTLIINGCECEPYITADDAMLTMYPEQVLEGAMILAKILDPLQIVLAVEDNKTAAIAALRAALPQYPDIHLEVLPTRYPQGAEKLLIWSILGLEVPSGGRTKDVGTAVFNAATCGAVSKAVRGIPLVRRLVTVTGEGIKKPGNMIAPIGTPVSVLLEEAGGRKKTAGRVICGGPMMGRAQEDLEVPIVKGTNGVLCLGKSSEELGTGRICIHCGFCVQACPMHLQPLYLYEASIMGDREGLERLSLMDCIECGCCSYTCPGRLPLVGAFREGKQMLREVKQ